MSSTTPPENDPTRSMDPVGDPTRRIAQPAEPGDAAGRRQPMEYEQTDYQAAGGAGAAAGQPPGSDEQLEVEQPGRRGRALLLVLLGLVIGVILTLIVVALGTSSPELTVDDPAAQERLDELEAQLAERDTALAELEAQLDEAQAAAGERDEDIQIQLDALDDRTALLDQRTSELDARQDRLDARESALDDREAALEQAEQQPPATDPEGEAPVDNGGTGGVDLPEIDTDELQTALDRLLETIRDLFGG